MNTRTTLLTSVIAAHRNLTTSVRRYWSLVKGFQTLLLLITGLGGYMSVHGVAPSWTTLLSLAGSLFLSIGGSTILNMVWDRDIDARMKRTAGRPLPAGRVSPREALQAGLALSWLGVGWGFSLSPLYGIVVLAGLLFDVVVYTLWLKRRTPWAILWGGISGGMPVLAGRVLGAGQVDLIGILLALGVLAWIPSHIMPLNIKYLNDYKQAKVPTFPGTYGLGATRVIIGLSVTVTVLTMLVSAVMSGIVGGYLYALGLSGLTLLAVAVVNIVRPSPRLNFGLFKLASLYMLGAMVLIIAA